MNSFRQFLKFFIPFALAVLLLWIVLNQINIKDLIAKVSSAKLGWVSLAIFISLLSHLSRAYRWNILLEPLGYKPKLSMTFAAVMIGYFGNIFLPRAGEVMRCLALNRRNGVPFNSAFGTVVAERAIDFLCLLVLIAFSFLLEFDKFQKFFSEEVLPKIGAGKDNFWQSPLLLFIIFAILVTGFILLIFRKAIVKLSLFQKGKKFVGGLLEGIVSVTKSERKGAFLLHTVFIWAGYFLMTYLMFFSLKATSSLGFTAGLVILIVGGLGMSAPVSGGIGAFHYMVAKALMLFYQISENDGVAYAFVIHESQLISIVIVGGFCALLILIPRKSKKDELVYDRER